MDIGIISVRYARALLKASTEALVEDKVYQDMISLVKSYISISDLKTAISNPILGKDKKRELLLVAIGNNRNTLTERFVDLVLNQDRESMMMFIANSYVTLYRKQKNIIRGKLITATAVSPRQQAKMQKMVESYTSGKVDFETEVDPAIIGGFILEYDTYRMDASVRSKLQAILSQLKAGH